MDTNAPSSQGDKSGRRRRPALRLLTKFLLALILTLAGALATSVIGSLVLKHFDSPTEKPLPDSPANNPPSTKPDSGPAEPAAGRIEMVSLSELLTTPDKFSGQTFFIDRVKINGEKKQQAHPGYHIKIDPGDGKYTFFDSSVWGGFIISPGMSSQMDGIAVPSDYEVQMLCKLEKGPGGRWGCTVSEIDFYDSVGKVTLVIK